MKTKFSFLILSLSPIIFLSTAFAYKATEKTCEVSFQVTKEAAETMD